MMTGPVVPFRGKMHAVRFVVLSMPMSSSPEVRGMTGYTVYPTRAATCNTGRPVCSHVDWCEVVAILEMFVGCFREDNLHKATTVWPFFLGSL